MGIFKHTKPGYAVAKSKQKLLIGEVLQVMSTSVQVSNAFFDLIFMNPNLLDWHSNRRIRKLVIKC